MRFVKWRGGILEQRGVNMGGIFGEGDVAAVRLSDRVFNIAPLALAKWNFDLRPASVMLCVEREYSANVDTNFWRRIEIGHGINKLRMVHDAKGNASSPHSGDFVAMKPWAKSQDLNEVIDRVGHVACVDPWIAGN